MLKTSLSLQNELAAYASPRAKITQLIKSGKIIQVRRGLYTDEAGISPYSLAPLIYGPSYISFQTALAFYGLIPERVYLVTSAVFRKNKNKFFETPLGGFRYLCVPEQVYPYGITMQEEGGYQYLLASPEKALCDAVYKISDIRSVSDMDDLLIEDWRMERDELLALDSDFIQWLAPRYRRRSLAMLARWFKGGEE